MNKYISIKDELINEITIEKSRFITYLKPVSSEEQARNFLETIRKKHYDATHNCYAYIIGALHEIQKSSDDGEPSGTAGVPILESIKHNNLTDIICIVTRYFGGIKLGAGGLVRAYSKGASEAINQASLIENVEGLELELIMDYQTLPKVENFIINNNYQIINKQFYHEVNITIIIPKESKEHTINSLINLTSNKIEIEELETVFYQKDLIL